jgi:hypothetical protein
MTGGARVIDPAVLIPGFRGRWGLVDTIGDFVLPPSAFSPNLIKELGSSLGVFVPRIEADATKFGTVLPSSTTTGPIQGAFISVDGTSIRGVVRASTLGYHLDGESFADVGTTPESQITVAVPDGATIANLAVASLGGPLKIGDRSVLVTSGGAPGKAAGLFGGTTEVASWSIRSPAGNAQSWNLPLAITCTEVFAQAGNNIRRLPLASPAASDP